MSGGRRRIVKYTESTGHHRDETKVGGDEGI